MILRPSLTLCARTLRSSPLALRHTHVQRSSISTTPSRRADLPPGVPDQATLDRLRKSPMWEKLRASPEALAAAQKFGEVMQKQGIDTLSGKPPSTFQMAKLFLKADVRDAAKELYEAFGKAGIDLQDPELMKQLMGKEEPKK
ncbi:hypothetical protein D9619_001132 [Psilocybe cf. subviscida]|uniref:Uncharacterized protein n=1 Tax=Psilocybe cf. subviscida TaxID=2480587 RepID=A0A8H5F483_9AGAR|nr:hypothetical protein D9619_001132 [Psilocybe cf. subviscida]